MYDGILTQKKWDCTGISRELNNLLAHIEYLFIADSAPDAGCMKHGFVRYVVCDVLKSPLACWEGGRMKSIGGPNRVTVAIIARCLSRMANWCRLTVAAVSAEFPSWDLIMAFEVFDLARHCEGTPFRTFTPARQDECFKRLAVAFGVDKGILEEEWALCLPAAIRIYKNSGDGSSVKAFAGSAQRLHTTAHARAQSPLVRVLHVATCWDGLSTSPVEQSFSLIKSLTNPNHRHVSDVNENIQARLCCDLHNASEEVKQEVFTEAKLIWARHWPTTRKSGAMRHGNFARKRPRDAETEKSWIKAAKLETALNSNCDRLPDEILDAAVSAGHSTWNGSLEEKEEQLLGKRDASKYSGQHVIFEEMDQVVVKVVEERAANKHKENEANKRKTMRFETTFQEAADGSQTTSGVPER